MMEDEAVNNPRSRPSNYQALGSPNFDNVSRSREASSKLNAARNINFSATEADQNNGHYVYLTSVGHSNKICSCTERTLFMLFCLKYSGD